MCECLGHFVPAYRDTANRRRLGPSAVQRQTRTVSLHPLFAAPNGLMSKHTDDENKLATFTVVLGIMYAVVTGNETFGVLTALSVRCTPPSRLRIWLTCLRAATAVDGTDVRFPVRRLRAGRSGRRLHAGDHALRPQGRDPMRLHPRMHRSHIAIVQNELIDECTQIATGAIAVYVSRVLVALRLTPSR